MAKDCGVEMMLLVLLLFGCYGVHASRRTLTTGTSVVDHQSQTIFHYSSPPPPTSGTPPAYPPTNSPPLQESPPPPFSTSPPPRPEECPPPPYPPPPPPPSPPPPSPSPPPPEECPPPPSPPASPSPPPPSPSPPPPEECPPPPSLSPPPPSPSPPPPDCPPPPPPPSPVYPPPPPPECPPPPPPSSPPPSPPPPFPSPPPPPSCDHCGQPSPLPPPSPSCHHCNTTAPSPHYTYSPTASPAAAPPYWTPAFPPATPPECYCSCPCPSDGSLATRDVQILQALLQVEQLLHNYYSNVTNMGDATVERIATDFSSHTASHISALSEVLTVQAVNGSEINLDSSIYANIANAAFGSDLSPAFDAYSSGTNFLMGASVTSPLASKLAMSGLLNLQSKKAKKVVAGVAAALVGQHATVETLLLQRQAEVVAPGEITAAEFCTKLYQLRSTLVLLHTPVAAESTSTTNSAAADFTNVADSKLAANDELIVTAVLTDMGFYSSTLAEESVVQDKN